MNQVKIIKSEAEYKAATKRLLALMDEPLTPGSDAESEFELLALVISDYELKMIFKPHLNPIEAILFRMDQMGLSRKDILPYFGSEPRISEVFSGKRALSITMIRKLHAGLGIPAEVLIQETKA